MLQLDAASLKLRGLIGASLLAFLLITLAWRSHEFTRFNGLAMPLFCLLAVAIAILASHFQVKVRPLSLALYAAFISWIIFVDLSSQQPVAALAKDSHWIVLPLAVLLLGQLFTHYPRAILAVQLAAGLGILTTLAMMYDERELHREGWLLVPVFGHIRHLGLSIGALALLMFETGDNAPIMRLLLRMVRIAGLALVFWSGTRSAMLGILTGVLVITLLNHKRLPALMIDLTLAIVMSLIPSAVASYQGLFNALLRSDPANNANALSSLRISMWSSTLGELDRLGLLWTGAGGNGFVRIQMVLGAVITPPRHIQPHNIVVQAISDWGLIGAGLMAAFATNFLLSAVRSIDRSSQAVGAAVVAYLAVTGALDATLYHLEHLTYLAFGLAICIAATITDKTQNGSDSTITIPRNIVLGMLGSLLLIHHLAGAYSTGLPWYFPTN